jgi:hypothetical protein
MMNDFTTTFSVDQTPEEAFSAINRVRAWWSGEIEGSTDKLGDEFTYRYEDIHYSRQKVTELTPGRRVVWLVLDSRLNFAQDKSEWTGTTITFDISRKGDQTEVRFTHVGLVPEVECFEDCSSAWGGYINGSLRSLIAAGAADPAKSQAKGDLIVTDQYFTTTFSVDQTPSEVFDAVTNVRGWWSEEIEGGTAQLNDEFVYHYKDVHRCKMRLTDVVRGKRMVWLVLENHFGFTQDQTEWTGTEICFAISAKDGQTEVRFTHQGLVPEHECFEVCSKAWGFYINGSLRSLITAGEGEPNRSDRPNLVEANF